MDYVAIQLYSHGAYRLNEPISILFELINHTAKKLYVLPWYTPLEGLRTNCLDVRYQGKPVTYDGIMGKKGAPSEKDFILLLPGQSIRQKIMLEKAYAFTGPGTVEVNFKKEGLVCYTGSWKKKSKKISIKTKAAFFTLSKGGSRSLTLGEAARKVAVKRQAPAARNLQRSAALIGNVRTPLFAGGTADQQNIVLTAHQNGADLASQAAASLANDAVYQQWFGAYVESRFQKVKGEFQDINTDFLDRDFTYDLSGAGCMPADFGYTQKGGSTIWICPRFWDAPPTGTDSQAGTIVHEHSHASAFTEDVPNANDPATCQQLAIDHPEQAITSADNLEYYAQG